MARLIKSDSLMWYRSQIVVISSFSDKGILKQVWYWCLIIWCSFHQFEYGESVCSLFRIFFSVLIYELKDFPSDPIEVWGLVPLVSFSFELLLISSLYRSIYGTLVGYLMKTSRAVSGVLKQGSKECSKGIILEGVISGHTEPCEGNSMTSSWVQWPQRHMQSERHFWAWTSLQLSGCWVGNPISHSPLFVSLWITQKGSFSTYYGHDMRPIA